MSKKRVTVVLAEEQYQEVKDEAEKQNRSVSNLIVVAIKLLLGKK